MLKNNVKQKRMSSFLQVFSFDQKLKGSIFLILENKNYGRVSFVSAMLLSSLHSGARSFHQIKTLAVFQDENKSDLDHVALSETDIISERNPMLLKLLKKVILYVF